ncbi:GGDEF domain-containing protein [Cytobacillus firmus]|uniref:GGDEF domain-containing protein n=1 Tax=Cytobacillus firmus TaxID=1399 RepID=UPI0024954C35|nr:GGDEF domain-containing protein [Cytobacillus firmus]
MCFKNLHKDKLAWLSEFSHIEMMNCLLTILDIYNVVLIDKKGEFVRYNQQFKTFIQSGDYHFADQGCIADVFKELKEQHLFASILSKAEHNGIWSGRLLINSSDFYKAQVHISRVSGSRLHNPIYMFLFFKDEAKSAEEKWKELAYTDELTGLSNWRKFREKLSAIKKERESFGLLFIDINKFKEINDQHGHIAGDKLLQLCSNRIKEVIGLNMHAFRKSGDEFLVIVEEVEKTEYVEKKIKRRLSGDFLIGESAESVSVSISVSIGLSTYPALGQDEETLIHHADMSMLKDKMRKMERGISCGD